jgi:glycosyltransferase involved in cell wall biosynthesis
VGRIPFILFGDGPRLHSGLGRIARDLATQLVARQEDLGIRLVQVGVDYPSGWHFLPWELYGFQPTERDMGRSAMQVVLHELQQEEVERPIVLLMTDPSRCFDLTRASLDPEQGADRQVTVRETRLQAEWWGYFPIDGHNPSERVGGPAAEAVKACTRVLGYGRYGAGVLKRTLDAERVAYLPHGLDLRVWHPAYTLEQAHPDFAAWAQGAGSALRIGCVATNQPRKDFGLLFAAVADLKQRGYPVRLWLHTDLEVKAWSVVELARSFAFTYEELAVTALPVGVPPLPDEQLAAQYAWSDVTCAPGLGEGFGYPIVESLACGTPCVHGRYAGGVELIPDPRWLVEPVAWRLESGYVIQRPVFKPADMAAALELAATYKRTQTKACQAYCAGSVAHLDWRYLWGRWESWIRKGLETRREEHLSGARATAI